VSWHGGDVFAASYNGSAWLLSGLGSDSLRNGLEPTNHMALAVFNNENFNDLSSQIPNQWDAVLFANAWNGHYWLVGGGWEGNAGVLLRYDGANLTDLSSQLESVAPFHSVQTIKWNGDYWLIGGVGFLVKYDGQNFTNLTPALNSAVGIRHRLNYQSCCNAVNALAWNGSSWEIGGGAPLPLTQPLTAWIAGFDGQKFTDLSSLLPSYISNSTEGSSILTATFAMHSWFFGGYANQNGMLVSYANSTITDLSYLVDREMTTVNWVGGLSSNSNVSSQNHVGSSSYLEEFIAPKNQPEIRRRTLLADFIRSETIFQQKTLDLLQWIQPS
jgi:hypothetical protein